MFKKLIHFIFGPKPIDESCLNQVKPEQNDGSNTIYNEDYPLFMAAMGISFPSKPSSPNKEESST